jgi:hypothetical protein
MKTLSDPPKRRIPKSKGAKFHPKMSVKEAKDMFLNDFKDLELAEKQLLFVANYCTNGFKIVDAVIESGYAIAKTHTAYSLGGTLIRQPKIVDAIRRFIDISLGPYKSRLKYEVMEIYYRRATYSVAMFYDDDGDPKPLSKIPPEWLVVIDDVIYKTITYGGGKNTTTVTTKEYKLADRDAALQMLAKYSFAFDLEERGNLSDLPEDVRDRTRAIFANAELTLLPLIPKTKKLRDVTPSSKVKE